MKYIKICVIGLGYIGLPTASTFAMNGIEVLGVDISPTIIETLNRGEIHIH
ncbi:MAG TPA: 3-hydroxyacyl-CoA dehydrogenase NAD-binding domain-containing protein, partial [Anaerolineales bacterium]|nr:3-hydroxyacyl-CoA dehydrogenase NAD-binding domain-containing protein [Anaerolineales bacterium]